ncbi:MAG TPA: imidazole glycerol phosphate synthase subunit HisH [Methylomirabilota bacterium]|jgi:glutamine amidotransferase|nr:imidazole glycerol phosphate synthase subunit HisH [Methylomirabilota bacterium]
MIAIVDYGRGNLGSVEKLFRSVGVPAVVTQDARAVDEADAVVFPGDGAFHDTMNGLRELGLAEAVRRALDGRRPFLGICIGYQLLFSTSEEFGDGRGLDVIPGVVRRFPAGLDVPHMGWNRVWHGGALRLFDGIEDGARFYFVHSYYPVVAGTATTDEGVGGLSEKGGAPAARSRDSSAGAQGLAIAWCEYGVRFAAAIERGRLFATQFHPEKSQAAGIRMLKNFAAIVKEQR